MNKDEADALNAAYERDRCTCGGSPRWVHPDDQRHRADCSVSAIGRDVALAIYYEFVDAP